MIAVLSLLVVLIAFENYQQDQVKSLCLIVIAGLLWFFPVATICVWFCLWLARSLVG